MDIDKDKNKTTASAKETDTTSNNAGLELSLDDSGADLKKGSVDTTTADSTKTETPKDASNTGLSLDIPNETPPVTPVKEDTGTNDITSAKPSATTNPPITKPEIKEEPFIDGLPEPDIEDGSLSAPVDETLDMNRLEKEKKSNKKTMMAGVAIIALGLGIGGYFVLSSKNETSVANTQQPITGFTDLADLNDDMPGFSSEDNTSNIGFLAPPQPDLNEFSNKNSTEDFAENFTQDINTAPKPIDENINITDIETSIDDIKETNLNDGLPTPPIDLEDSAILVEDVSTSNIAIEEPIEGITSQGITDIITDAATEQVDTTSIETVNTEPPIDIPMEMPVEQSELSNDSVIIEPNISDFEDIPEISNLEQAPNNIGLIPPTVPSTNDINTDYVMDTAIAPDTAPAPSAQTIVEMTPTTQTATITNAIDNAVPPSQGSLQSSDTDMRDSLKDMPARKALIRPLPKKYMIIESSNTKTNRRHASTKRATTALRKGNAGAALGILEKIDRKNPGNKSVMMKQAIAYQQMGNIDFALKKYEDILRQDPTDLDALTNMLGLLRSTKPQLALNKLHELRDIYPDNAGVAAQLAIAYAGLKHYDEALKSLDVAAGLDSPNAYYAFNKGVFLDHLGRRGEATEMYKQALQMYSNGMTGMQPVPIEAIRKRLHISY